jgi:hypothetical protein
MEEHREPKRELQSIPAGVRSRGKRRKRWLDDVEE